MDFYWLLVGILAVWRLTHLLNAEDGPWEVVVRVRRALGSSVWGSMLDCFNCLSVWMALPIAAVIGESTRHSLVLWPALSGGAILLERVTRRGIPDYIEESGEGR
jgi:hypothetical protein